MILVGLCRATVPFPTLSKVDVSIEVAVVNAQLIVISGPEEGKVFPLEQGRSLVVGRGQPCHCRLRDPRVSRTHFLLEKGPLAYRLFDMGSSGGTFVNGDRVNELDLAPGDVIRLGQTEMRFVMADVSDATTIGPGDAELGGPGQSPLSMTVGKTLAGFELQAPIGEGRLGYVFRAFDPKRKVTLAMQILRPEFSADKEEMRRFVRAMKTAMRLRHPNIVRLHTAGKTGGYCFVVMEYVDGESLTAVIRRIGTLGMLDWSYAYRVGVHVTRALQAARHEQIIHRNITPSSILIRREDGLAKLGDLMLAKAIEGALAERITQSGVLVGDLAYMAPERTHADADVDGRSDVYGLGATLYALLTGRPPLEDKSPTAMVTKIRDQEPDPPKKYQLAVPDMFEGLVMRMLAKRPEDRLQSPEELLDELDRVGKYHGLVV